MERQAPGRVRDAITGYLQSREGPATVSEICDAVRAELGQSVSPSSVRSYLRLNVDRAFERTSRGTYALHLREEQLPFDSEPTVVPHAARDLVHDDCLRWLGRQPPQSIHAVVTDPPYGMVEYRPLEQAKLRNGKGGVWRIPPSFDGHQRSPLPRFTTLTEGDLKALEKFFLNWAMVLLPVLVPGANVVIASNPLVSHRVAKALSDAGLERRGEIVRLVMTMRGGDRPKNAHREFGDVSVMPRSMWEPWLCFRKPLEGRVQDNLRKWKTGGFRRISKDKPFGDVIPSHPTRSNERQIAAHPSLKPQSFMRPLVRAVLPLGEGNVLDPFAGAGSTIAAAIAVGYRCIGIESDPHYVEIARRAIVPLSRVKIR
ncbi:MAG TPA: DNA methyltransferase [Stellaceae bacterium]|nr:DNA methyltransferase [Stellaceae bacterium]